MWGMCPGKTIKVPGFAMQPSSFAEKHLCSLKSFDTNAQSQLLHLRCTLRKPGVWLLRVCSLVQFQFSDYFKVENIWGDSLDMIPSPSVKIQLLAGKFTWGNEAKHCWVMSTNFLFSKVCWQRPAMFCLYIFKQTLPPIIWRWWDQIQATF